MGEAAQNAAESNRSNPGNNETRSVEVEATIELLGGILSRTPPRGSKKAAYSNNSPSLSLSDSQLQRWKL